MSVGCSGAADEEVADAAAAAAADTAAVSADTAAADTAADGAVTTDGAGPDGAATPGHPAHPSRVDVSAAQWSACPAPFDQGDLYDCLTVPAPLDYAELDGPTIPAVTMRVRATATPRRGQLWLLQGGPGGAGSQLSQFVPRFQAALPDLDLYLVDHRGVGWSGRLGCPTQEAASSPDDVVIAEDEWLPCAETIVAERGAELGSITTSNAARDVLLLMAASRATGNGAADEPLFVYGVSYGTFWANRLLQVDASLSDADVAAGAEALGVDAVVMDSMCPPGLCRADTYDEVFDEVTEQLLGACDADPACAEKLPGDGQSPGAWAFAVDVLQRVEAGHCAEALVGDGTPQAPQFDALDVRRALSLVSGQVQVRGMLPALLYRLDRCSAAEPAQDPTVLGTFLAWARGAGGKHSEPKLESDMLGVHIMLAELWGDPSQPAPDGKPGPTQSVWEQGFADVAFSAAFGRPMAMLREMWPVYGPDSFTGQLAQTDVPLLVLNATLDQQTPPAFAEAVAGTWDGPDQHVVVMQSGSHGTIVQSPLADGVHCGMKLTAAFLSADHRARAGSSLDVSCKDAVLPPDTTIGGLYASAILGVSDVWGDEAKADGGVSLDETARAALLSALRDAMFVGGM